MEKERSDRREETDTSTVPSLRGAMIKGTLWMVAMRWGVRGIGLVSTLILVRLLQPEDFGLIAMAMIVVGMMEVMSSFGIDMAIIRLPQAHREHLDTAWTIGIIQGFALAAVLVAIAPLAGAYFREPRVVPVVEVIAIGTAIGGFANVGTVLFRKELEFGREFAFTVARKLLSFVVTLSFAVLWRNYWALAAGFVAGQAMGVVVSYLMHPYRPRWCLLAVREFWSFSQWMLLINIGNYLYDRVDEFIVGRIGSARQLGLYSVSYEVSNLPTTELMFPLSRALFPGFAKLVATPERLEAAYLSVLAFVALFAIPAGVGISAIASDLVAVFLGEKWAAAQPLIELLAYYGAIRAVYGGAGNLLVAMGRLRYVAIVTWAQVISLVVAAYFAGQAWGVTGIAEAKIVVAILFAVTLFASVCQATAVRWGDIGLALWRPVLASAVMAYIISITHHSVSISPLPSVLADIAVGALSYVASVLVLWHLAGLPGGAEQFVLQTIAVRLKGKPGRVP